MTGDITHILRNWYDSALYFLQESQFLRVLDIHNVQTIVVLGTSFINFGDFNLYYHLWGCAPRMGQALRLHLEKNPDTGNSHTTSAGRWLWWSLVINDWLQIPLQAGHSGVDRITAGPGFPECVSIGDDKATMIEPMQFQVVLARLASTLRQFHESLVFTGEDFTALTSAVTSADNDLATIVSLLPRHLQPDEEVTDASQSRDEANSWLPWQKENLCVLLLYYRLVISRPLWNERNDDVASYENARNVCLDASHGILASINEFDSGDPIAHRRLIWSFLLPAFGAAATLKAYSGPCSCGTTDNHKTEVDTSIMWFEQAARRSAYAASAIYVLREL